MLAIIGPRWTDARNGAGQRRLEDSDDFVRIELEAALARDIPVVPVLVAHAAMPVTSDLPASLASMVFRQSIEVRPDPDFHNDATRLVSALRQMLDPNAPLNEASSGANASRGRFLALTIAFAMATLVAAALVVPAVKYLRQVTHWSRESISSRLPPIIRNRSHFRLTAGRSCLWRRATAHRGCGCGRCPRLRPNPSPVPRAQMVHHPFLVARRSIDRILRECRAEATRSDRRSTAHPGASCVDWRGFLEQPGCHPVFIQRGGAPSPAWRPPAVLSLSSPCWAARVPLRI